MSVLTEHVGKMLKGKMEICSFLFMPLFWHSQIKLLKCCGRLKMYYINTLKQELSTAKTYEDNRLDETSVVEASMPYGG